MLGVFPTVRDCAFVSLGFFVGPRPGVMPLLALPLEEGLFTVPAPTPCTRHYPVKCVYVIAEKCPTFAAMAGVDFWKTKPRFVPTPTLVGVGTD